MDTSVRLAGFGERSTLVGYINSHCALERLDGSTSKANPNSGSGSRRLHGPFGLSNAGKQALDGAKDEARLRVKGMDKLIAQADGQ